MYNCVIHTYILTYIYMHTFVLVFFWIELGVRAPIRVKARIFCFGSIVVWVNQGYSSWLIGVKAMIFFKRPSHCALHVMTCFCCLKFSKFLFSYLMSITKLDHCFCIVHHIHTWSSLTTEIFIYRSSYQCSSQKSIAWNGHW